MAVKVLLLDVDGVLNSNAWYDGYLSRGQPIPRPPLDREAVKRLDRIVRETGAWIVLSTSWRGEYRLSQWLCEHGCSGAVVGRTPYLYDDEGRHVERGVEIASWVRDLTSRGTAVRICILDDGDDMGELLPYLVQTTQEHGLQDEHVERAIALLTAPVPAGKRGGNGAR